MGDKDEVTVVQVAEVNIKKTEKPSMINRKSSTIKEKPPVLVRQEKPKDDVAEEALWREEWKILACIIDRLCFYVFVIILVVGNIMIVMNMSSDETTT